MCEMDTRPLKDPRILSSGLLGFLFQDSETGHWHFEPQTGLRLGSPSLLPDARVGIGDSCARCQLPKRAAPSPPAGVGPRQCWRQNLNPGWSHGAMWLKKKVHVHPSVTVTVPPRAVARPALARGSARIMTVVAQPASPGPLPVASSGWPSWCWLARSRVQ
jgi:hypothetical protein